MLLILLSLSCNGSGTKPDDSAVATGAPQLWYYPDTVSFSPANLGTSAAKDVTVRNTGATDLTIRDIAITGTGAFTLGSMQPTEPLAPGKITSITVNFTPVNPHDVGTLTVLTDDPLAPSVDIPLEGFALVPSVALEHNPLDFGLVPVGCTLTREVKLNNVGYATLKIEEIVNTNPLFEIPDVILPLEENIYVDADASWGTNVVFHSLSEGSVEGEIWFTATDILGLTIGIFQAVGTEGTTGQDEFWQSEAASTRADILVFASRTSSMADNEGNLRANIADLSEALIRTPLDWQLGVVTKDDGCVNVGVVTPVTFSGGAVLDSAFTGDFGLLTDEGLTVVENALGQTGEGLCNQGLLRNVSKPVIIVISDGADQSAEGWEPLKNRILEAAPGAVIHSVVPSASGVCETSVLGAGYQEAATATGGVNLDFCDDDWGSAFNDVFSLLYSGPATTFLLSSFPNEASIEVKIDGAANTAWTYDPDQNAVVFQSAPKAGAHIVIDYDLGATCG